MLDFLKEYNPKHDNYVTLKNNLIDNASKFYKGREKIIEGFKNGVFPLYYDRYRERRMKSEEQEEQEELKKQGKKPFSPEEVIEWIIDREKLPINHELFKKHFKVETPILMYKDLYETNNDKEKNSELVKIFNSGLKDLKEEI